MNTMIYQVAIWLVPLVFAIVLHEISHGWVANALGDPTAKRLGRLTLNPIKHVDPIGTVVLPLILAITKAPIFGWAKPVPVVAERLRHPRRDMVLVALAGPAINLALALATAVALGLASAATTELPRVVADLGLSFLIVNVGLALFNLIPLPPFDGGHVVEGALPRSLVPAWQRLGRVAFPLLIVLLLVLPMISDRLNIVARLVAPPANALILWFLGIADALA
ncbi:MAG: site-2 protease family protein [Pseudomonadota bacterium]